MQYNFKLADLIKCNVYKCDVFESKFYEYSEIILYSLYNYLYIISYCSTIVALIAVKCVFNYLFCITLYTYIRV